MTILFEILLVFQFETLTFPPASLGGEYSFAMLPLVSTDLVVWGSNLASNLKYPRYTKLVSSMVELPAYYISVFVGVVLSDGSVQFASASNKNARLVFKQSLAHFPYFWFVYTTLSHYCSSLPGLRSGMRAGVPFFAVEFGTRALPCITVLHSLFYVSSGPKILPPVEILYELLTPVALAHWIIGDGSVSQHGIFLCTESFTPREVILLVNVLIVRYGLDCTLSRRGDSYRIYVRESAIPILRNIVLPYMHKSILYKIKADRPQDFCV